MRVGWVFMILASGLNSFDGALQMRLRIPSIQSASGWFLVRCVSPGRIGSASIRGSSIVDSLQVVAPRTAEDWSLVGGTSLHAALFVLHTLESFQVPGCLLGCFRIALRLRYRDSITGGITEGDFLNLLYRIQGVGRGDLRSSSRGAPLRRLSASRVRRAEARHQRQRPPASAKDRELGLPRCQRSDT